MLELLLCSLLTILPDYLYRRYVQGKRLGKEITLYSVWFELRWGIIACLMLTVGLITVVFYNHPSTSNATVFFRTIPILPETNGRVAEVFVGLSSEVKQGAPIFRLDSSKQEAAAETARRKIAEVEAELMVAKTDIQAAAGRLVEARGAISKQWTSWRPSKRSFGAIRATSPRAISRRLQVAVEARQGGSMPRPPPGRRRRSASRAVAGREGERRSRLAQAEVELGKTVIRAG